MKIGLAPYEYKNNNIEFNLSQIEKALNKAGSVDLLCFGEAFLQGFGSVTSEYDTDIKIAVEQDSPIMERIKALSLSYRKAIMVGYIEKDQTDIYSSYALIENGKIIYNYRRISKNWKDYEVTNAHYKEGSISSPFEFHGIEFNVALCGDMWIFPEKFKCSGVLIWPVYVNFDLDESEAGEYAKQAAIACPQTLLVNSLSTDPVSRGGAFYFVDSKIAKQMELDREEILVIEI
mgnify:FL=1